MAKKNTKAPGTNQPSHMNRLTASSWAISAASRSSMA